MKSNVHDVDLCGKTIRLSWIDGPTKDKTHEHVFHADGTVEWYEQGAARLQLGEGERPRFAQEAVADGIALVSYHSQSGYTLTAVLNFIDRSVIGVASSDQVWVPVHGSLEVVR